MSVFSSVGKFNQATSVGNQSITGLGFQPSVVLFWINGNETADGTGTGIFYSMGAATSSSNQCYSAITDQDAGVRLMDDANCIGILGTLGVFTAEASFVSMNSSGFTINWTTNDGTARQIFYMAIGGSDVTGVTVGNFQSPGGVGDVTVSGLGFTPNSILLFGLNGNSAAPPATQGPPTTIREMIGAATSSSQAVVGTEILSSGGTQDNENLFSLSNVLADLGSGQVLQGEASLVSFGSDQFTLSFSPASNRYCLYLAMAGPSVAVGSFSQPSSRGAQSITGLGFQPAGVILFSANAVSPDAQNLFCRFSFGAASSTQQFAGFTGIANAGGSSCHDTDSTKVIKLETEGLLAPTVNASASLQSMDPSGFTLNWSSADATARVVMYLAIGSIPRSPWALNNSGNFVDESGTGYTSIQTGALANPTVNPSILVLTIAYTDFNSQTGSSISGIADSSGNNWTRLESQVQENDATAETWWAPNATSASGFQVTITFIDTVNYITCIVDEFTGGARGSGALDQHASGLYLPTANPDLSPSITPSQDNSLIYGGYTSWDGATPRYVLANPPFTMGQQQPSPNTVCASEYDGQITAATIQASFNESANALTTRWLVVISFKPATAITAGNDDEWLLGWRSHPSALHQFIEDDQAFKPPVFTVGNDDEWLIEWRGHPNIAQTLSFIPQDQAFTPPLLAIGNNDEQLTEWGDYPSILQRFSFIEEHQPFKPTAVTAGSDDDIASFRPDSRLIWPLDYDDTQTQSAYPIVAAIAPTMGMDDDLGAMPALIPPFYSDGEAIEPFARWVHPVAGGGPAAVPYVPDEKDTEQINADPRALQYDDTQSQRALPPTPLVHTGEELFRFDAHKQSWDHDDTQTQRVVAPVPPFSIEFEESEQKNIDWHSWDSTEIQSSLTTPHSIQFEETEQENIDRRAFQHDDLETYSVPATAPMIGPNQLLWSQDFENAVWVKTTSVSVAPDSIVAPDLTLTADAITYAGGGLTSANRLEQLTGIYTLPGVQYTISVWLMAPASSARSGYKLGGDNGLTSITITTSWQRYSVTFTGDGLADYEFIFWSISNSPWTVYFWGAQVEAGPSASAYDPTFATSPLRLTNPDYAPKDPQDVEISEFWVGWKSAQHEDTDTESAALPPSGITGGIPGGWRHGGVLPVESEDGLYKNCDVRSIHYDDTDSPKPPVAPFEAWEQDEYFIHAQDRVVPVIEDAETQRELQPTPPQVQQEEYEQRQSGWSAQQPDDESLLVLPPKPPATIESDETSMWVGPAPSQPPDDSDLHGTPPAPIIAPDIGLDDLDTFVRALDSLAFSIEEANRTLPPLPPSSIESDESSRWIGAAPSPVPDDSEQYKLQGPPPPIMGFDDLDSTTITSDRTTFNIEEDNRTLPPSPPSTVASDEFSRWSAPPIAPVPDDSENYKSPVPVLGSDDLDSTTQTSDRTAFNLEEDNRTSPPSPPPSALESDELSKFVGLAPTPVPDDSENYKPPAPPPPTMGFDDLETLVRALDRFAFNIEEDNRTLPPQPPLVDDEKATEQVNADRRAQQYEDAETQSELSPSTMPAPLSQQEEYSEQINADVRSRQHDDTVSQRALPPSPPAAIESDESTKWVGPTPSPVPDDSESYKPIVLPPPIMGFDDLETSVSTLDKVAFNLEEDNRNLPPSPPYAVLEEHAEQKTFDSRVPQHDDRETQRALPPTPPVSQQEEYVEQMNVDRMAFQYDDTETAMALPPTPPTADDVDSVSAWSFPPTLMDFIPLMDDAPLIIIPLYTGFMQFATLSVTPQVQSQGVILVSNRALNG